MSDTWLLPPLDGVAHNLEIHGTRQRRSWALAELPQQLAGTWRDLASAALQMPSDWLAVPHRTTSWYQSYVSPLYSACQNLSLAIGSKRGSEVGTVGGL